MSDESGIHGSFLVLIAAVTLQAGADDVAEIIGGATMLILFAQLDAHQWHSGAGLSRAPEPEDVEVGACSSRGDQIAELILQAAAAVRHPVRANRVGHSFTHALLTGEVDGLHSRAA